MNSVFIHIPKTAGTYIAFAFGLERLVLPRSRKRFKQKGHVTFGHQDYNRLVRRGVVSKNFDESAFKYTFCRNPFDRAVSHFFYARRRHPEILDPSTSFIEYTRNLQNYKRYPRSTERFGGKLAFRPQYKAIENTDMDFIGRFENINYDLIKLSEILGVSIQKVPRKNYNRTKHEHYPHYYNSESIENVRNYYKKDFDLFGYDYKL